MSVPTDVGADAQPFGTGVFDRLRANSLARDVGIVSVVSLVLGLFRLGAPSLWVDESFTARAAHAPITDYVDGYHWLYYSIVRPWTEVAGTSEWALRVPSVFGAMLASALTVVLGRRLFDRWVGLVAGLLIATSPFVVQWSQQARGYTLLLALSVLATLLLMRALDTGTRRDWIVYGLVFASVIVWHPVGGLLLVPAHALLAYQRRERVLPHGLLAVVIVCALGVPWAAQIAMRSTGEGVAMDWLKAPSAEVALRALLDVSGATGLGVLLGALGVWILWRTSARPAAIWLSVWALSPFLVALVVSRVQPIYLDRYLLVAAPAFALLGGVALTRSGRRSRFALAALALVLTAVGLGQWYSTSHGNWRGEDWRSAVRTVLQRRGEADAIVVAPWSAAPAARYYGADVVDVSTADRIWVLTWSETEDDISAAERRGLGFGDHVRAAKLQFGKSVSAQLWVRPGS